MADDLSANLKELLKFMVMPLDEIDKTSKLVLSLSTGALGFDNRCSEGSLGFDLGKAVSWCFRIAFRLFTLPMVEPCTFDS